MSYGVGRRCGSDPELLWLWYRPAAAAAPIWSLAREFPYAMGVALKRKEKKKKKGKQERKIRRIPCLQNKYITVGEQDVSKGKTKTINRSQKKNGWDIKSRWGKPDQEWGTHLGPHLWVWVDSGKSDHPNMCQWPHCPQGWALRLPIELGLRDRNFPHWDFFFRSYTAGHKPNLMARLIFFFF